MLVRRYMKTGKRQRGWIVAPTFPLVREDWLTAEVLLRDAITSKQQTAMKMDFGQIGFLEYKSAERDDEGLRGAGLDCLVVDEASRVSKKAWEYGLRPSLADKRGRAVFISTPKGRNWFWDMYLRGQDNDQEVKSWQHPTYTNPYFPKDEWVTLEKRTPEMILKQEYLAEFLEDEATVFHNLSSCFRGRIEEPIENEEYVFGFDLARTHDFTVGIGIRKSTRQVIYFSRHRETDWSLQKELIKSTSLKYNRAKVLLDSTGVGDPIEEDLRKAGCRIEGYKFNNTTKQEMIEQLIVAIEQGLIGIPNNLEILINELKAFEYELLPSGKIRYQAPEGLHDDCVISLGLAVMGIRHNLYSKIKKVEPVEKEGTFKWWHDRVKKVHKLRKMPENSNFSQTELWEYVNA